MTVKSKSTTLVKPDSGDETAFAEVVGLIEQAKRRAFQAVNTELIGLYWKVGEYISCTGTGSLDTRLFCAFFEAWQVFRPVRLGGGRFSRTIPPPGSDRSMSLTGLFLGGLPAGRARLRFTRQDDGNAIAAHNARPT